MSYLIVIFQAQDYVCQEWGKGAIKSLVFAEVQDSCTTGVMIVAPVRSLSFFPQDFYLLVATVNVVI